MAKACPDGEHECRFPHYRDHGGGMADFILYEQAREYNSTPEKWPKFNIPAIVCGYHFRKAEGCFRGTECAYAHWKPTGVMEGEWKYHDHGQIRKTRAYWMRGNCNKSAETCQFAHEETDEVAEVAPWANAALVCPFWFSNQYESGAPCSKGDRCKFSHQLGPKIAYNPRTKALPREYIRV